MKISLDLGHGVGQDRGAVGYIYEETIINEVGSKVAAKLRALGHTVIEVRPTSATTLGDSLSKRCAKANSTGCDINLSIHANAGGGVGTEIFTYKGREVDWARRILNNIVALGFRNRGVKGNSLYMTNHTSMPSALLEICFVDTQSDVELYKKVGAEAIADAIVRGTTGKTVTTANNTTSTQQNTNTSKISTHLRDWQYAYNSSYGANIIVDGIRGDQVEKAMRKAVLKFGCRNGLVAWLQCRIGAGIDGIFGIGTKDKVVEFQKSNGLVPDGVVGYNTWNALLKKFNW